MSYFNFFRAHDQFMPRHFGFRGGGFMHPRGGNVSITENINIQQGPSGFWGFMTGLTQGLFGGGCGMGMGSIFGGMPMMGMGMGMPMMGYGMSPYAMLNGSVTPQGVGQTQSTDKQLTSLTSILGSKGTIARHPDKPDVFLLTTKDGKIIEGTFQELIDKFKDNPDNTTNTGNTGTTGNTGNTRNTDANTTTTTTGNTGNTGNPEGTTETHVKVKPEELKNGVQITVIDEVWDAKHPNGDGHISGTTVLEKGFSKDGFANVINIGGKRYKLQPNKVNGDPVYRSENSQEHDTYRLSKKDGKLVLIQTESDKGKLDGVGSADFHPRRRR